MFERRRQTASPVSLLVVTLVCAWACSSGDHVIELVTTSGGAGSEEIPSNVPRSNMEGGAPSLIVGLRQVGSTAVIGVAGASGEADVGIAPDPIPVPPAGGADNGTAGTALGGSGGVSASGAPSSGGTIASAGSSNPSAAGAGNYPGVAGSPPVAEVGCSVDQSNSGGAALPCSVSTAFYVCRNCHSNPPVKGVQHPYVTYADIKPRAAQIHDLVTSGVMPWPPYKLNDQQKATIIAWLGKEGTCAIGAATSCQ